MRADPIELEVFKHLFHAVAEEMGAALRRTAFSPNIKERRDYSCALFDAAGNVLAMGDRKSTRLNSSHLGISYAVFCLEKKSELKSTRPKPSHPGIPDDSIRLATCL